MDLESNTSEVFAFDAFAGGWSPDNRTLAYSLIRRDVPPPGEFALAIRERGGAERILRQWSRTSTVVPTDWTPDGRAIIGSSVTPLFTGTAKFVLWPVSAAKPVEEVVLEDVRGSLWQARVSPNGKWLTVVVQTAQDKAHIEMFVARQKTPSTEWIRIAADHPWPDKPRWSPDGRLLYFVSNHGASFFNLWAIRFDPERGTAIGTPFPLTAYNSPNLVMTPAVINAEIGIAARRAILPLETVRGSIWLLEDVDR